MRNIENIREKYIDLGKRISSKIRGYVEGLFIVGSIAHQHDDILSSSSDLDLVVISNSLDFFEIMNEFKGKIPPTYTISDCDSVGLHSKIDGIDVGIFAFYKDSFLKLCRLRYNNFTMFRNSIRNQVYRGNDFDGNEYVYRPNLTTIGTNYVTNYNPILIRNRRRVLGIQPHFCLANPRILYDNGIIGDGFDVIWKSHVRNFNDEISKGYIKNSSEENFLKVLYLYETMSQSAKDYVLKRATLYLRR